MSLRKKVRNVILLMLVTSVAGACVEPTGQNESEEDEHRSKSEKIILDDGDGDPPRNVDQLRGQLLRAYETSASPQASDRTYQRYQAAVLSRGTALTRTSKYRETADECFPDIVLGSALQTSATRLTGAQPFVIG